MGPSADQAKEQADFAIALGCNKVLIGKPYAAKRFSITKSSIGLIDEVVVCTDTTASGGNAALLAEVS